MSRSHRYALAADTVFDGRTTHNNAAAVIDGAEILRVIPQSELPGSLTTCRLAPRCWLAPGFIDVQVNGGGDVLFNNSPTPETIATMVAAHRRFGTTALLPTFITDTKEKMRTAILAAESLVGQNPSVLGIHLEGPYLSPEKPGVHDPGLIRAPDPADAELLCGERKGARLVTLAPERVPKGFIARLVASGIRVSLGHSMATYQETRAAMREGLSGFTHLFNAMRPPLSREPGPVTAALEDPDAWFGLIVDGFHVDPAMVRLALRGNGHAILVTDAMPPVGGHRSKFHLYGAEIDTVKGRCVRADGTLAGAALDMVTAVRNCVRLCRTSLEEALRFASTHPADFIGLGHRLGRLAPGHRADMVALDPDGITVSATWVAGDQSELTPG